MIRKRIISLTKVLLIELNRVYDHVWRYIFGLPTMKRSQVTPNLYLGGQYSLRATEKIRKRGITAVVNMRMTNIHKEISVDLRWLSILHLPTQDLTAPTMKDLKKGAAFIDKVIQSGGSVYVHCRQGEGRGPTMAIAYLISQGLTLDDALAEVRVARTFVRPTHEQMERLQEFASLF